VAYKGFPVRRQNPTPPNTELRPPRPVARACPRHHHESESQSLRADARTPLAVPRPNLRGDLTRQWRPDLSSAL